MQILLGDYVYQGERGHACMPRSIPQHKPKALAMRVSTGLRKQARPAPAQHLQLMLRFDSSSPRAMSSALATRCRSMTVLREKPHQPRHVFEVDHLSDYRAAAMLFSLLFNMDSGFPPE
jgi:hypothetical protein